MKRAEYTQGFIGLRPLISSWEAHKAVSFLRTCGEHLTPPVGTVTLGKTGERCWLLSCPLTLTLHRFVGAGQVVNQMQYSSSRGSHVPMKKKWRRTYRA